MQLYPNALRILISTLILFRLHKLWDINAQRFSLLFQLKENHGSSKVYSFSTLAQSNIIVGFPESDKDWKDELVVLEGAWAQKGTPKNELPRLKFAYVNA